MAACSAARIEVAPKDNASRRVLFTDTTVYVVASVSRRENGVVLTIYLYILIIKC